MNATIETRGWPAGQMAGHIRSWRRQPWRRKLRGEEAEACLDALLAAVVRGRMEGWLLHGASVTVDGCRWWISFDCTGRLSRSAWFLDVDGVVFHARKKRRVWRPLPFNRWPKELEPLPEEKTCTSQKTV